MDIDALRAELIDDPLERGYSGMTDKEVADRGHVVDRVRNRRSMTGREVAAEIVNAEYDALTDAKKNQILSLTSGHDIDPFGFAANVVKNVFGPDSDTVVALRAARVERVGRWDELELGPVRAGDVQRARGD